MRSRFSVAISSWFSQFLILLAAGLILFGVNSFIKKNTELGLFESMNRSFQVTTMLSNLVHETQRERGLTAGFIGSRSGRFRTDLDLQRKRVDRSVENLRRQMNLLDKTSPEPRFSKKMGQAMAIWDRGKSIRKQISNLSVTAISAIQFYTRVNEALIDSLDAIVHDESLGMIRRLTMECVSFLRIKDRAGIERATLGESISRGSISHKMYRDLITLSAEQNLYNRIFLTSAPSQIKKRFESILSHEAFKAVQHMRDKALADDGKGLTDVEPEAWFKVASLKLGMLREFDNYLLSEIRFRILSEKDDIEKKWRFSIFICCLGLSFAVVSLVLLFRKKTKFIPGPLPRGGDQKQFDSDAQRRGRQLSATMIFILGAVLAVALAEIGWSVYNVQKNSLMNKLIGQKEIIEAVARFDAMHSRSDHDEGAVSATLSQVVSAKALSQIQYQGSKEVRLAERRGDQIVYLLLTNADETKIRALDTDRYKIKVTEFATPFESPGAKPMRRALRGSSGAVITKDYKNTWILAAHTPLNIGDNRFGLMVSIHLWEVILPVLRMGLITSVLAILLVSLGVWRFLKIINPMIWNLEGKISENKAMIAASPSGIISIDKNGTIFEFNTMAESQFGYSAREVIGRNMNMLTADPDHLNHDQKLKGFMEKNNLQTGGRELSGLKKDRSTFPIHLSVGEMLVGTKPMFIGMVTDMTEIKTKDKEIRQHRDHLEELVAIATAEVKAIVQTAVSGILTIDQKGIIHIFNPSAEALFGWTRDEVIGRNVKILMESNIAAKHDEFLTQYLKTRAPNIIGKGREITARRKDGSLFPAYLAVGHAELAKDHHYFVGFISDISDQKRNEAELKKAKEHAEAGARIKTAFIANMSHEIRTPMNAIIGFAEVVSKDPDLSDKTAGYVNTIFNSGKALLGIINDILDVSKIESNKFSLETICFHLPNALSDALKTLLFKAQEKKLALELDYHTDLCERFLGDPTRLRQVFLNLVGNAIKFTEKGGVYISVFQAEEPEMLHFKIRDTGIGMPLEQIQNVFEPFVQADESTTRRFGGTGLGTTICKQIVELMGGQIWVDSEPGKGSVFHFTVRLSMAEEGGDCLYEDDRPGTDHYSSPRSFDVLLVEDVKANAELAILRLEQQGHKVHWAANGSEAVAAFREKMFDLILMDVMMPVLDGLEATKAIRALEKETNRHTPIVALTASVMREEYRSCIHAGMNAVQAKPIDFDALFAVMEDVVPSEWGKPNLRNHLDTKPRSKTDFSMLDGVANYEKALRTWQSSKVYAKALKAFASERQGDALLIRDLTREAGVGQGLESAMAAAHRLKGVAANLSLHLAGVAGKIENSLRNEDQEGVLDLISELGYALDEACLAIQRLFVDNNEPEPTQPFDAKTVEVLITDLLVALDKLNPDAADPMIGELGKYLPLEDLEPVKAAIDKFDFDIAKTEVQTLAEMLGFEPKE